MRALLLTLSLLAASCGGGSGSPTTTTEPTNEEAAWPSDGFLEHLPDELSITARLPPLATREAKPKAVAAMLEALGRPEALWAIEGVDPERGAGLAVTTGGGQVHYLPARDKAAINANLGELVKTMAYREEADWVILSRGGAGAGKNVGAPLPPGDAALRARFHPLLDIALASGDSLELGATLGAGGVDFSGAVRTGETSATRRRLAARRAAGHRGPGPHASRPRAAHRNDPAGRRDVRPVDPPPGQALRDPRRKGPHPHRALPARAADRDRRREGLGARDRLQGRRALRGPRGPGGRGSALPAAGRGAGAAAQLVRTADRRPASRRAGQVAGSLGLGGGRQARHRGFARNRLGRGGAPLERTGRPCASPGRAAAAT